MQTFMYAFTAICCSAPPLSTIGAIGDSDVAAVNRPLEVNKAVFT